MKVLDLFSGIGGFSLGLERAGMKTIQFVENEPYCQKVLAKNFPGVPIHGDIKTFHYDKPVEIISGGFPCQPYSHAGEQRGKEDDRHLWEEYFRIIQSVRSRWVLGENVSGIINMELDQVLSDLEGENYSHQSLIIPACAVNAPHRRDRVWIIARRNAMGNSEYNGLSTAKESRSPSSISNNSSQGENKTFQSKGTSERSNIKNVAHANKERIQGRKETGNLESEGTQRNQFSLRCSQRRIGKNWSIEPELGRVANGIPSRVDRIKSLGNAVVPQIVEIIGRAIMEIEENKSQ